MINRTTEWKNHFSCFNENGVRERFRLWWVVAMLFVVSLNGYGQGGPPGGGGPTADELYTSYDDSTGFWSDDATWVDGSAPAPANIGVNIAINGYVTSNA